MAERAGNGAYDSVLPRPKIPPASRLSSVRPSAIRRIHALATPLSINLGLGEPNLAPDEHLRELAMRVAREGEWKYSPNAGSLALREAISANLEAPFDPSTEICVTAGTEEALFAVIQAYVGSGDEVLVPDPGFPAYPALVRLAEGEPKPYRLDPDGWGLSIDAVEDALSDRTRAIVINSPSNPTGATHDRDSLVRLAEIAERRGLLLISDEVYREIHYEQRPATLLGLSRNAVVVTGLSKSHGVTGLRIGWAIAPAELMRPIVTLHQYITTCASVFSQRLAELILTSPGWNRDWLERARSQFAVQREAALFAIERYLHVTISPPPAAFYAFVPISECRSEPLARDFATEAAVIAIPGSAFGSSGEGFLRISFAASAATVAEGIERMGRYLDARESFGALSRQEEE